MFHTLSQILIPPRYSRGLDDDLEFPLSSPLVSIYALVLAQSFSVSTSIVLIREAMPNRSISLV